MRSVALRLLADALLVAIMLFASAGTFAWWRAWVLLAVMMVVRAVGALSVYRISPDLMRERAKLPIHDAQPRSDRVLLLAVLATGFLGLPAVAAYDAFHWHALPEPPATVAAIGLGLFAFGWTLKSLALRANAFATSVVRLQNEREHAVADSGVYAVVRHPFYLADPLIYLGLAAWLQSYLAALCAVVPIALMVTRLQLEERFLRRELPGYDSYTMRVPHRLIPGVW